MKIGGEDRDILIVIGNEVDAVTLTHALVKKFSGATLVRVEPFMNRRSFGEDDEASASIIYEGQRKYYGSNYYDQPVSYYNPPPPQYYYSCERPAYDSSCSIM